MKELFNEFSPLIISMAVIIAIFTLCFNVKIYPTYKDNKGNTCHYVDEDGSELELKGILEITRYVMGFKTSEFSKNNNDTASSKTINARKNPVITYRDSDIAKDKATNQKPLLRIKAGTYTTLSDYFYVSVSDSENKKGQENMTLTSALNGNNELFTFKIDKILFQKITNETSKYVDKTDLYNEDTGVIKFPERGTYYIRLSVIDFENATSEKYIAISVL